MQGRNTRGWESGRSSESSAYRRWEPAIEYQMAKGFQEESPERAKRELGIFRKGKGGGSRGAWWVRQGVEADETVVIGKSRPCRALATMTGIWASFNVQTEFYWCQLSPRRDITLNKNRASDAPSVTGKRESWACCGCLSLRNEGPHSGVFPSLTFHVFQVLLKRVPRWKWK